MKALRKYMRILLGLLLISTSVFGEDIAGSADHPLITRYPGSTIEWYDVQAFDQYKIATGPVTGYRHIDDWIEIEGKLTRIYYVLNGSNTLSEVFANYKTAVKKANFQIITEGLHPRSSTSKKIGGRGWLQVMYRENVLPTVGKINLLKGSATSGGSGYLAAKLERPQGTVFLSLAVTQYKQDQVVFMLDVLEEEAVKDDLVQVDADAMSKDIEIYGKVALYGIHFDHDKATIKPESKPALDEIAQLLEQRTDLQLYVVGHTDMSGTLAYNIKLSEDRAQEVVKTLIDQYGIASKRLEAQGVGPLVPVFANQEEAGRARNRRVELVRK